MGARDQGLGRHGGRTHLQIDQEASQMVSDCFRYDPVVKGEISGEGPFVDEREQNAFPRSFTTGIGDRGLIEERQREFYDAEEQDERESPRNQP